MTSVITHGYGFGSVSDNFSFNRQGYGFGSVSDNFSYNRHGTKPITVAVIGEVIRILFATDLSSM